jgi:hypothetical protein
MSAAAITFASAMPPSAITPPALGAETGIEPLFHTAGHAVVAVPRKIQWNLAELENVSNATKQEC